MGKIFKKDELIHVWMEPEKALMEPATFFDDTSGWKETGLNIASIISHAMWERLQTLGKGIAKHQKPGMVRYIHFEDGVFKMVIGMPQEVASYGESKRSSGASLPAAGTEQVATGD